VGLGLARLVFGGAGYTLDLSAVRGLDYGPAADLAQPLLSTNFTEFHVVDLAALLIGQSESLLLQISQESCDQ
jgi:hypothetical protein